MLLLVGILILIVIISILYSDTRLYEYYRRRDRKLLPRSDMNHSHQDVFDRIDPVLIATIMALDLPWDLIDPIRIYISVCLEMIHRGVIRDKIRYMWHQHLTLSTAVLIPRAVK